MKTFHLCDPETGPAPPVGNDKTGGGKVGLGVGIEGQNGAIIAAGFRSIA